MKTGRLRKSVLLIALLFVLKASYGYPEEIKVVGALYEPFLFYDTSGRLRGFDLDMLEIISRSAGLTYRIEIVPFEEALRRVETLQADMAIGAIYVTEERKKRFHFTVPYQKTGLVPVFRATEVFPLSQIDGKRVGVKKGATGQEIALAWKRKYPSLEVISYLSTEESFEALVHREVDMILNDYINTVYLIAQRYPGQLVIGKTLLGPQFLQRTSIAWPVRKGREDLLEVLNREIKRLASSGTLQELSLRWLYISQPRTYWWLLYYIGGGVLLIAFGVFAYLRYHRQRIIKQNLQEVMRLLEGVPGALFICQDGRLAYANEEAIRFLNLKATEEAINTPIERLPFFQGEGLSELLDPLKQNRAQKGVVDCSFSEGDQVRYIRLHLKEVLYRGLRSVLLFAVDVTRLKQSEELLRRMYQIQYALNRVLRVAAEAESVKQLGVKVLDEVLNVDFISFEAKGALFVYDPDRDRLILYASRNLSEEIAEKCREVSMGWCLCGRAAERRKVIYKHTLDSEHEVRYAGIGPHGHYCVPLIERDELLGVLTLYLRKDHQYSEMEVDFLRAVAEVLAEAIRRLKLQEEVSEKERMFLSAFENLPAPLMIHNEDRSILYINRRFTQITGYTREELQTVDDFVNRAFSPEDREEALRELQGLYQRSEPHYGRQKRVITREGKERVWEVVSMPIGEWRGKKTVLCVAEDLTEEKTLREQLFQAQKLEAIGRLTGAISHDFNNILTAIMGYTELALKDIPDGSESRKKLEVVYRASERAARLVQQLLAFSKRQVLKPEVVNLNKHISEMRKLLERLLGEDIELKIKEAPGLWDVYIDPVQLEQVIMNLAVNARDAMPEGGTLTIETANTLIRPEDLHRHPDITPGEYVVLTVADTGVGMTEEVKRHIFEPFFTTKPEGKGTGLGLATVYGIIKQSGGSIYVYSEPGMGATFRIYLPRYTGPDKRPEGSLITEGMPRGTETILLVEDDEEVRKFTVEVLKELGYTVIECARPSEALETCDRYHGRVHLLITDVIMPEMDGRRLAEKMLEICPEMRVLYITGYPEETILDRGVLEKDLKLLQKPFTAEALARAVREALEG